MKNISVNILKMFQEFIRKNKIEDGLLVKDASLGFNLACDYLIHEIQGVIDMDLNVIKLRKLLSKHNWAYKNNPFLKKEERDLLDIERKEIENLFKLIPMNEAFQLSNMIPLAHRYDFVLKIQTKEEFINE